MEYCIECDKQFHRILEHCERIRFRELDENYEYYYAEKCIYVLRNKQTGIISFVHAGSPVTALQIFMKSTLKKETGDGR